MTLSSSCSNETHSFDSYLSICTDFCPAPHSNHLGGVSEPLYNWSHRTILIHHDHSFFFYLATWQRPPPTFTLQAKYWQMKNAKGKEILSPSSNIFQWPSGSKLECGQLTQSQKILQALGQVAESLQGVFTPWNLSLWAPAFMDQRKGQPQDLWWICGPRVDSEPCPAVTLVSKPWVAWSPHPLILCFHSVLPALVHVAKIPLLTHDVLNSHDLWMCLSPLQGESYIFLSPETSTAPGTQEGFTKGTKPQKTPLACWLQALLRGLWAQIVNYKLVLVMGTCHPPLQGLNPVLLQLLIFNTPWKEFMVETRNEALCAGGGGGRRD